MSSISNIYDAFITRIETVLPTYTRIPDPYDPEKNASLLLTKGYGIGFGPAVRLQIHNCPKLRISRQFFVVLVNQVTSVENDASSRGSNEKALVEDEKSLIISVEQNSTLAGTAANIDWISSGGIEFLAGRGSKYFLTELIFEAQYFESTQ